MGEFSLAISALFCAEIDNENNNIKHPATNNLYINVAPKFYGGRT